MCTHPVGTGSDREVHIPHIALGTRTRDNTAAVCNGAAVALSRPTAWFINPNKGLCRLFQVEKLDRSSDPQGI